MHNGLMSEFAEDLTPEQIEELREQLELLLTDLEEKLDTSRENVKTVGLDQPIGRLTRMDAMQQQKMAQEERRRRDIRRNQVRAALSAIESGEYGYCRRCEEPIGLKRLKAKPESPFCVACMGAVERR